MEFSFGSQQWLPKELVQEKNDGSKNYALGLHAPGFFDKILNVDKCLLQSEPANMVIPVAFVLSKASMLLNANSIIWLWKLSYT